MHLAAEVDVEAGRVEPIRVQELCVWLPIVVEGAQELHCVVQLPSAGLLNCLVFWSVLGACLSGSSACGQPACLWRLQALIIQQL